MANREIEYKMMTRIVAEVTAKTGDFTYESLNSMPEKAKAEYLVNAESDYNEGKITIEEFAAFTKTWLIAFHYVNHD